MQKYTLALICALLLSPLIAHADAIAPPIVNDSALSLSRALILAAQDNVLLKETHADADTAAAEARSAQAQTRPSVSATTYATLGDSSNILTTAPGVSPENLFNVPSRGFADQDLMLMVPLYTGGKLSGAVGASRHQANASSLSFQASRLTVTDAVTAAYTNAALQQALVAVAQSRLNAEDAQVQVTQAKVTTGRLAPVDLLREQAEDADARQGLLLAQNQEALALIGLKTALGISQASQIALSDTLGTLPTAIAFPATLVDALSLADAHRPEIAASQRQVDAAKEEEVVARSEYAPQVYGIAMGDAMAGQSLNRLGYTVGVTASIPIFEGGQRQADTDAAHARRDRAEADAEQVRQFVDEQVATAWLNRQTAIAQVQDAVSGVTAAQEGYRLAELLYNANKSTTADRLDALSALVRAQGTLAQAKAGVINADSALSAALGISNAS
jgi:outer membrane protein TolC